MSTIFTLSAVGVVVGAAALASFAITTHIETREIVVQSKERLMQVTSSDKGVARTSYRNFVYTADEAYTVEDSLWNGHFTSSTVYARLHEGARCKVTLAGYRFGFLSMFQNIIKAECSS